MPAAGEIFKQIALCRVKLQHFHEKKLAFEFSRGGLGPPGHPPEHAYERSERQKSPIDKKWLIRKKYLIGKKNFGLSSEFVSFPRRSRSFWKELIKQEFHYLSSKSSRARNIFELLTTRAIELPDYRRYCFALRWRTAAKIPAATLISKSASKRGSPFET